MSGKLPTMAVRNAIAYVDARGFFNSHLHIGTRMEAERHGVEFNFGYDGRAASRLYSVTDEGRAIAARGTLAHALAWVAERGFVIEPRRSRENKSGFIQIINKETGVEGFISDGSRVYLPKEGHRWQTELAFTAKAGGAK